MAVKEKENGLGMLPQNIEAEEVQKYIRDNIHKEHVKKFVNEYIENVSIGIVNIINIFEPEAISFGGSFSYYEDIFLPILELKIKEKIFNRDKKCNLISAKLKNDAGMIGATIWN